MEPLLDPVLGVASSKVRVLPGGGVGKLARQRVTLKYHPRALEKNIALKGPGKQVTLQFHTSQPGLVSLKDFCFSVCKHQEPQLPSQLPTPSTRGLVPFRRSQDSQTRFQIRHLPHQPQGFSLRAGSESHLPRSLQEQKRVWILPPVHQEHRLFLPCWLSVLCCRSGLTRSPDRQKQELLIWSSALERWLQCCGTTCAGLPPAQT